MTEPVYTIQHAANGKHHLKKRGVSLGFFPTHAEALDGMDRAINPEKYISNFDENGTAI